MERASNNTRDVIESSLRDAEELATAAAELGDSKFRELRDRVQGSIKDAQTHLKNAGERIEKKAARAADALRHEVRESPGLVIGSAAVAMLAVGFACGYSCAAKRA
jgi:ElaB/YqjD/DUF883 family membrane-anchored ribosome-binding protein